MNLAWTFGILSAQTALGSRELRGRRRDVIAHVGGVAVEETLLPLVSGLAAGPPQASPVVPDDDDLGVEDPGQHQRRQQRQQVENEQQPRLARVQPDLQRRDVRLHPLNVGLHLAQPRVDALREPVERGDGLRR